MWTIHPYHILLTFLNFIVFLLFFYDDVFSLMLHSHKMRMIDKLNLNGVAFQFPLSNFSFLKHRTVSEFWLALLVKGNTNFPFIKFLIRRGLWPNDRRLPSDFHLRPNILWTPLPTQWELHFIKMWMN